MENEPKAINLYIADILYVFIFTGRQVDGIWWVYFLNDSWLSSFYFGNKAGFFVPLLSPQAHRCCCPRKRVFLWWRRNRPLPTCKNHLHIFSSGSSNLCSFPSTASTKRLKCVFSVLSVWHRTGPAELNSGFGLHRGEWRFVFGVSGLAGWVRVQVKT